MLKRRDVSLAARTTLGLGGVCALELVLESMDDVDALADELDGCRRAGLSPFALGAGSNLLGRDGRHDLVLVRPALKHEPAFCTPDGEEVPESDLSPGSGEGTVHVSVAAGTMLPAFLVWCARRGLSGLEGLSGIPGSLGGAVAMNAGSFGDTLGDALERVILWHGGRVLEFGAEDLELGYRLFRPKALPKDAFLLVLGAVLRLRRDDPELVRGRQAEHLAVKKERQPVRARSAGCVFKNPADAPSAGVLLDRAGFRGLVHGGVAFSSVHANFLVNLGHGTATEALELLSMAERAVREKFGVSLELEVRGCPPLP